VRTAAAGVESGIVLQWLARLRWLAVAGQTLATLIAVAFLKLKLPLTSIESVIAITVFTNIIIQFWLPKSVWPWMVPAVLLLDVFLLTALLLSSGGPSNPFSSLYLVHVAMAVVTSPEGWSWLVAATATVCYGVLFIWPKEAAQPLMLSPMARAAADWVALTLVAIVTAYFVGRMTRSLRRHEKDLADARERAVRNERLAALTTLAAGAAHELNTPLSTIAVVARELELGQPQDSFVDDARLIRQEVNRCQFILGKMRLDALPGEGPEAESKLAPISDLLSQLNKDIPDGGLRVRCDPELRAMQLPAHAVRQAVTIMIDNALDASPAGEAVDLSIQSGNGRIVFEVWDRGVGMDADILRRVGEPFFTTKPPGEGMGLGLFLARLLAEKLGGSLTLHSAPGQGTRAVLELPREKDDDERREI
jgi:two-component system, sensor histidine kinase RegB